MPATLNIDTLELVSTNRKCPANGSSSSLDFNDGEQEKLVDLSSVAGAINDVIRPILTALPPSAASGLEGATIYADTKDLDPLFYDALSRVNLTVADSLRLLNGIVNSVNGKVSDLDVEVGQLSSKLASTNQNDISQALQSITGTLTQIQLDQAQLAARLLAIGA